MAYKFQFGTTKLSGSTTFEEALVGESTISGSGRLSGKNLFLMLQVLLVLAPTLI